MDGWGDGGDWVSVVDGVEEKGAGVASDFIQLVAAVWSGAERVGDWGGATVGADLEGQCTYGVG